MLQTSRARHRVGREVSYYPTDAEATAGGGAAGDTWYGRITSVAANGTVNINVLEADGGILAKTAVPQGVRKGEFSFSVRGGVR